jgi:hypothetical protein
MTNPYYNHASSVPSAASKGTSSALRAEFDAVAAGFEAVAAASSTSIIPPVTGNSGKVLTTNGVSTLWNNVLSALGITSSTIDNSPIGATTPSTGVFTSLVASSITQTGSLGAALNMGGFKATNQADGTAATDSATLGQTTTAITNASAVIQSGTPTWLTNVTGVNSINATLAGITSYNDGLTVKFLANATNTGATNISINGIGYTNITKSGNTSLSAGDIPAGATVQIVASGGNFQLTSGAGGSSSGGGATGGGKDKAFYEGDTFITSSFTVGQSAQSSCTISIASPAVITQGNTYVAGQPIRFTTTGALPTGLSSNAVYYVSATGLTTSSFQISATSGGASVNTSGTQSGVQTCGNLKNATMITPAYFATGVVVSVPTGSRLVGL